MTASMDSSGIPWVFTGQNKYYPVSIGRWNGVLSGYRTVEKSDVHASLFNLFGQYSSSRSIQGSDVDQIAIQDRLSAGTGQPGLAGSWGFTSPEFERTLLRSYYWIFVRGIPYRLWVRCWSK